MKTIIFDLIRFAHETTLPDFSEGIKTMFLSMLFVISLAVLMYSIKTLIKNLK